MHGGGEGDSRHDHGRRRRRRRDADVVAPLAQFIRGQRRQPRKHTRDDAREERREILGCGGEGEQVGAHGELLAPARRRVEELWRRRRPSSASYSQRARGRRRRGHRRGAGVEAPRRRSERLLRPSARVERRVACRLDDRLAEGTPRRIDPVLDGAGAVAAAAMSQACRRRRRARQHAARSRRRAHVPERAPRGPRPTAVCALPRAERRARRRILAQKQRAARARAGGGAVGRRASSRRGARRS